MSLDDGDSLRLSDKFAFFRGLNTDASSGRRDVPLNDLVTLLNDPDVLTNVGGGASQAEVDNLKTNLAINTLNDVIVEGRTVFEMIDQVADAFTDETGIDTVASLNESYNAAGDYYSPVTASSANMLLHCDGTDGSTTFTDATGNHTATSFGDAQIDTAQSKFGGASGLFDGTGDYVSVPDSDDFNFTDDATVDFWIRPTSTAARYDLINAHNGSNLGWGLSMLAGGAIILLIDNIGYDTTATLTAGVWSHIAFTKSGTTSRLFVDGVLDRTDTIIDPADVALDLEIGRLGVANYFNGHMDEIRVLKGTAAWTTGFTPPTSAYSLPATNMTLISVGFTADTAPTHARLTVLFDPVDAVTLNTDLIFSVSIDDGTTFATATMEYVQDYTADIRILTCDEIDLSGITSGTEVVIKAVTANEKDLKIHGWVVQWR